MGSAVTHRLADALFGPFGLVLQDETGQRHRLLDADAAVAEVAPVAREQLHGRRVMQVDVVVVRKDELDVAQRVLRAGPLADARAARDSLVEQRRRQSR